VPSLFINSLQKIYKARKFTDRGLELIQRE